MGSSEFGTRAGSLSRLQAALDGRGVDLIVLGPSSNLRYVLGYKALAAERLTVLLVSRTDAVMILPDFDAAEFEAATGFDSVAPWADRTGPAAAVAEAAKRLLLPADANVLVDDELAFQSVIQLRELVGPSPRLASEVLGDLRMIKSDEELQRIGRAGEVVSGAVDLFFQDASPGIAELALARELEASLWAAGAETVDFVLVQAGANSASPHHVPDDTQLQAGESVLLDVAVRVEGYFADITQQVFLGRPPDDYVNAYETVRVAQEAGVAAATRGATAHDVASAASEVIHGSRFAEWNGPRTGHGIGLDVHEPPSVVEGNGTVLEPGTVVTVEPGVYVPGRFGIRIEDTVVVTDGPARRLTRGARPLFAKPA